MKGVPGLLLAVGLGVVGAFCNWLYLAQKGQELDRVDFVGISDDVKINPGDKFNANDFRKISVPQINVGGLDQAGYKWSDRATLYGMTATVAYSPGEIVLRQQLKTLPDTDIKKLLAPDEMVLWLPVDTRTFVASLVNAGDQVSFIVPRLTPAAAADSPGEAEAPRAANSEIIGPFRILALGNRLGSQDVLKAAGVSASQENVMAVAVHVTDGQLDARGQRILEVLRMTNFQQVQVLLHPSSDMKRPDAKKR